MAPSDINPILEHFPDSCWHKSSVDVENRRRCRRYFPTFVESIAAAKWFRVTLGALFDHGTGHELNFDHSHCEKEQKS